MTSSWTLLSDPLWPWSVPGFGLLALGLTALVLVALTIWTYLGVRNASFNRVLIILGLPCWLCWQPWSPCCGRPSQKDELHVPSLLIIAVDDSESMTIQDEPDSQTRWAYQIATLKKCQPIVARLRDEHNVNVLVYRFSQGVRDFNPETPPDGKRTDLGGMLQTLFEKHRQEKYFRGLIVLSDGADNGTRFSPLTLASQWRGSAMPDQHCRLRQGNNQRTAERHRLHRHQSRTVAGAGQGRAGHQGDGGCPGFEHAKVRVQVLFDDQPVTAQDATLEKTIGNDIQIKTTAPSKPGEIKVTLKIDPQPGETSTANNEITTYLTVIKEGISVLLVDKERFPEPQMIADALRTEPRIRFYTLWLRGQKPVNAEQEDLFAFEKQHYDVIILGDVTAKAMRDADPQALKIIERLVFEKGTGLLMMGGYDSFGPSWLGTEIETLLPVKLDPAANQVEGLVKMLPTETGLEHFVLRLGKTREESRDIWNGLRNLNRRNNLGEAKAGTQVLARAGDPKSGEAILVSQPYGQGRTMAFACDTTYRWVRNPEGQMTHKRFWVNLALWLAKQEETEGNVWIIPDTRRLASGNKLGFTLGMKGKNGNEIKDAKLTAKVVNPQNGETPVPTSREENKERGVYWNTDLPGEYRVVVTGEGKDADGTKLTGEATARFVVYQDDAELVRRAANHDLLKQLADKGGGKFLQPEELSGFLEELKNQPLLQSKPKVAAWPDWKSNQLNGFMPLFLLLFVGLLTGEWFLRRRWGLV